MTLNFPNTPSVGQVYADEGVNWVWNGTLWSGFGLEASGGGAVIASDTAPVNPPVGQLWYRTKNPVGLFMWYVDGTSSQWVQTNGGGGNTGTGLTLEDADVRYLKLTGGTLTGNLVISPINAAINNSLALKRFDGTNVGVLYREYQNDHLLLLRYDTNGSTIQTYLRLTPTDITASAMTAAPAPDSIMTLARSDTRYLQLAGGTLTGNLTLVTAAPAIHFNENDMIVDQKRWRIIASNAMLTIDPRTDADGQLLGGLVLYRNTLGTTDARLTGAPLITPVADSIMTMARSDARYLALTGGTLTGDLTISKAAGTVALVINKPAGTAASTILGQRAGVARWSITLGNSTAETGTGDTGSDFTLARNNDAGSGSNVLFISRATGDITAYRAFESADILAVKAVTTDARILLRRSNATVAAEMRLEAATNNIIWQKADIASGVNQAGIKLVVSDLLTVGSLTTSPTPDSLMTMGRTDGRYLQLSGGTLTGNLTISGAAGSPIFAINKPTGAYYNAIQGKSDGVLRWLISLGNSTAETGTGDTGSDFVLYKATDAGVTSPAITVTRSSGAATVHSTLTISRAAASSTLVLNKVVGGYASSIQGQVNGAVRWDLQLGNGNGETGADAGSNFNLARWTDAGAASNVIVASRATGVVTFTVPIVNGSSDATLKTNIAPLTGALDKVNALKGRVFNMLSTPDKLEIGLIAQEVQPIVPELIQQFDHSISETETVPKMAVDYSRLTALLVEAIKELTAKVTALETGAA